MNNAKSDENDKVQEADDWNPESYDDWYNKFEGALENYVDWEILKKYLPKDKNARILDAACGTGRISARLVKEGYLPDLCDISPKMLNAARKKMQDLRVADKVEIVECDIRSLPFEDESYDLVICWPDTLEAAGELIRIVKKGGLISISLPNKWSEVLDKYQEDPEAAFELIDTNQDHVKYKGGDYRIYSPDEAKRIFESMGIEIIKIYGLCGWSDILGMPKDLRHSRDWDQGLFENTVKLILQLCEEPSVMGFSRHLALYGRKI